MTTNAELAVNYKKRLRSSFVALGPEDMDSRLAGKDFLVTRKYDGALAVLFFADGRAVGLGSGGGEFPVAPVFEAAAEALSRAGCAEAVIAAELYAEESGGRQRASDLRKALADQEERKRLRLAPFDIISLDGKEFRAASCHETHRKLRDIFAGEATCMPVAAQKASSKSEVRALFEQWVEKEGAEGLVVRSELPVVYKIKSRYSIDAAVVGFSESDVKGQVRTLLLALMSPEGDFQIIARCGGGLDEELRQSLFTRLSGMIVESSFIQTDSNHVAFRMTRPEIVVEASCLDILAEAPSGGVNNPLLRFENGVFRSLGAVPGVSLISPNFERFREDKSVNPDDVRLEQVAGALEGEARGAERAALPPSQLLRREVYKKESGGKLMVQKFLLWKTNKEQIGEYPAYVFSYSNFSSERAEPFQAEAGISDSLEQIQGMYAASLEKNIKKGWEKVE